MSSELLDILENIIIINVVYTKGSLKINTEELRFRCTFIVSNKFKSQQGRVLATFKRKMRTMILARRKLIYYSVWLALQNYIRLMSPK